MPTAYKVSRYRYEIKEVEYFRTTKSRIYFDDTNRRFSDLNTRTDHYFTLRENAVDWIRRKVENDVESSIKKIEDATNGLKALGARSKKVEEYLLDASDALDYWKTVTFKSDHPEPQEADLIENPHLLAKRVLNPLPPDTKEYSNQLRLYRHLHADAQEEFQKEFNQTFVPTLETYRMLCETGLDGIYAREAVGLSEGSDNLLDICLIGDTKKDGPEEITFKSLYSLEEIRERLRGSRVSSLPIQTVARKADYTGEPDESVNVCHSQTIEVGDPPQEIRIGTYTYPEADPDAEPPKKYGFELKTEFFLEDEEETKRIQEEQFPDNLGFEDELVLRSHMAGRMDGTQEEVDAYVFLRESGIEAEKAIRAIQDPSVVALVQDIERIIEDIPNRIGPHLDNVGDEQALEDVLAALDNAQEGSNHDQRVFGFLNVFFFAFNRPLYSVINGAFPDLNGFQRQHLRDKQTSDLNFFVWFSKLDEDYQGRVLRWIFDNYEGLDFEKARRIAAVQTPPSRPGL